MIKGKARGSFCNGKGKVQKSCNRKTQINMIKGKYYNIEQ